MFHKIFSLPLPLALLVWPIAIALGQGSLTPPPISASEPSGSPSASSASVSASSANGTSSVNVTSAVPSSTSSANFPSLSGYSPCVANCLGLSVSQAGCSSIVDVQCFCGTGNSTRFSRAIVNCISTDCPQELSNAESLSQQFCGVASPSVSLSFPSLPPTASSTRSSSATAPPSSSTANATTSAPSAIPTGSGASGVSISNTIVAVVVAGAFTLLGVAVSL